MLLNESNEVFYVWCLWLRMFVGRGVEGVKGTETKSLYFEDWEVLMWIVDYWSCGFSFYIYDMGVVIVLL